MISPFLSNLEWVVPTLSPPSLNYSPTAEDLKPRMYPDSDLTSLT